MNNYRKLVGLMLVVGLVMVTGGVTFAAPEQTKALAVSGTIPSLTPEMDIIILEFQGEAPAPNPYDNGVDVTDDLAFNFGELVHTYVDAQGDTQESGVWYSTTSYAIIIFAQGYGNPYEIRSTATITGVEPGVGPFFGVTPVYTTSDSFVLPDGSVLPNPPLGAATLGTAGDANVAEKVLFTSGNPSVARIIQSYWGIPPATEDGSDPFPGWSGIPISESPGPISGQVTLSIVAL